jgi:hypothetical protein
MGDMWLTVRRAFVNGATIALDGGVSLLARM